MSGMAKMSNRELADFAEAQIRTFGKTGSASGRKKIADFILEQLDAVQQETHHRLKLEHAKELVAGAKEAKIHAQHCASCHQDHAEGYAPSDECAPYCCCEGVRDEDKRVAEAKSESRREALESVILECREAQGYQVEFNNAMDYVIDFCIRALKDKGTK